MREMPDCFKDGDYDEDDVKCAGGRDYTYPGGDRPPCDYHVQCRARTKALEYEKRGVGRHSGSITPRSHKQYVRATSNHRADSQLPVQVPVRGLTHQTAQTNIPQPTHFSTNYYIPAYLSVPETRTPDQTIGNMLMREIVRGMGKSFGHTIAHFFDTLPMSIYDQNRKEDE